MWGWEGKAPTPITARRDRVATNLMLIGVDAPEQVRPGSQAKLQLYWQVLGSLTDHQPTLSLWSKDQAKPVSASPWESQYAPSAWPSDEIVVTRHVISVPASMRGNVGMVRLEGSSQDSITATSFRVEGVPLTEEAATNFGDQMLLLDHDISRHELRPGELFEMTIKWQGLADMDEDYTIFVHLLGPDGLPHGQVDVWPHDGTYPTSTWPTGEVIADTYRVPLDADAPLGPYRIEVGVYLLRTMGRLLVLNADSRPVDDKLLIEGLTVKE